MIHLFIGIDPSINSTGICIQAFKYVDESNYEKLYTKFYVIHGGKLRKKDLEAEQQFANIFQFINYDKKEFKEFKGIDNNKFELIGQKDVETTRQADLYYNMTISNFKDIWSKLQKLQRNISTMDSYMTQLETYSYGNIKPVNSN